MWFTLFGCHTNSTTDQPQNTEEKIAWQETWSLPNESLLGFDLQQSQNQVWASAPGTGTIYEILPNNLNQILYLPQSSHLGHQILYHQSILMIHDPLQQSIWDEQQNLIFEGALSQIISGNEHWYGLTPFELYEDGIQIKTWNERAIDISICGDDIGILFPFSEKILQINDEWYIEQDQGFYSNLDCFEHQGTTYWLLGGSDRVYLYSTEYKEMIYAPFDLQKQSSFGKSFLWDSHTMPATLLIGAPSAGEFQEGWVGAYHFNSEMQIIDSIPFWEKWSDEAHANFGFAFAKIRNADTTLYLVSAPQHSKQIQQIHLSNPD